MPELTDLCAPKKVVIDGEEYVPKSRKIPDEALELMRKLVRMRGEHRPLASRLEYLLTDGCGRAR